MSKRVLAVEQFDWLSASRQAAEAGGMGLRTGKIVALAAVDWIGSLNVGTTDTKAAVFIAYFANCERFTISGSAFCHTFGGWSDLDSEGGEGVAGAVRPAFYNTFGRRKFMRIARSARSDQPPAEASLAMPAGSRKKKKGGWAAVIVIGAAPVRLWRKSLLGREKESGAICAVRLTKHGAAADQFTPGMQLDCIAITSAVFEYDGSAPLTLTPTDSHE